MFVLEVKEFILIDKARAIWLKECGNTNKQIAEELGCSVDWCKRNLVGVQKNKPEKSAIQQAIKLAQSQDGITNVEIINLIRSVYPKQEGKEYEVMESKAIARFKDAINKADNTIIRPYWIQPDNAKLSFDLVLAAVDNMSERMNDEIDWIRKKLDLSAKVDPSLRFAIIKMLMGSTLAREGIENHCNYLADIVTRLEDRNNKYTLSATIDTYVEKCAPKPTDSEKCITVEQYELMGLDAIVF